MNDIDTNLDFQCNEFNYMNDEECYEDDTSNILHHDINKYLEPSEYHHNNDLSPSISATNFANPLEPQDKEYHPTFEGTGNNGSTKSQEWFEYYSKKADNAYEQEAWHYDRAEKASAAGDELAAKDHIKRAKAWHNDAEKHLRSAKLYKP